MTILDSEVDVVHIHFPHSVLLSTHRLNYGMPTYVLDNILALHTTSYCDIDTKTTSRTVGVQTHQ